MEPCAAGAPDPEPLPPPPASPPPPPLGFLLRGDISPVESFALGGGDSDDPFRGDPGAVGIPPVLCFELPSELLYK